DILLLISDSSRRGIQAVGRIAQMIGELKLNPGVVKLIVNRAPGGVADEGVLEEIKKQGLDLIGVLPQDELVYRYDCEGKPSSAVPEDSAVKRAMSDIISKLDL
ncbi:MAG: carbon monoxide dehydrogenase, partial [Clostridiales bacterium]|nr:carbon monoxide dehydrogenase [Clostridiales bacterium]